MRHLITAIAAATLTGCALTPIELREQGNRTAFQRPTTSIETATCLARVIDEYRPFLDTRFASEMRPTPRPGEYEVRMAINAGATILAEVVPSGSGSRVTIWKAAHFVWPLDEAMAKGC